MDLVLFVGDKQFSSWSIRAGVALMERAIDYREILVPLDYHVKVTNKGFEPFPLTRPDPATGCMCEKSQLLYYDPTGLLETAPIPKVARVPILCDVTNGVVIPELLAMCEYLNERNFGSAAHGQPLLPEKASERALVRSFTNLICFDYLQLHEAMSYPYSFRDPDLSELPEDSLSQIEDLVEDLEKMLVRNKVTKDDQFMFGEFGLADIILSPYPQTFRGWRYDLSGHEIVEDYFERLSERQSVKRHIDTAWDLYRSRDSYQEGTPAWIARHYRYQEDFRIIHNFRSNICHRLENDVAWDFFMNAYEGHNEQEIVNNISRKYSVNKERAKQDLRQFLLSISPDRDPLLRNEEFSY